MALDPHDGQEYGFTAIAVFIFSWLISIDGFR
jgi:hypothetical protein